MDEGGRGPSLLSLLSILVLLVGLSFQALLLLRTRPQPLDALSRPLADVENAVRSLESSLRHLLAQRDQERMALEQTSRVAEQPARHGFEPTRDRQPDLAMRDASPVNPADLGFDLAIETSAAVSAPPRPPATVVGEYDQARNSPDQQRAIERFERMYPGTRLSLINSDELRTNPRAIPQFQSHGRGYFLAIAEDGRWQCFPWFSFDLTDETYKSVFEYRGTNALRVTRPAILDRQGDMWTLATRGVVENTL